jgi:CubicO group peptidase (beta-lactamase class C family)
MNRSSINFKKQKRLILILLFLLTLVTLQVWPKVPQPPDSVRSVSELDAYLEKLVNSGTPPGSHPAFNLISPLLYLKLGSYIRETSGKHIWMKRVYTDQTPSSALIGSPIDAARLVRAYLNNGTLAGRRILSEKSITQMTNDSHVAKINDKVSYFRRQGIGWQIYKERDGYKLEHTGGGPGFYTIMQVYPSDKLGLILFCNDVMLSKYGWKILRLAANLNW